MTFLKPGTLQHRGAGLMHPPAKTLKEKENDHDSDVEGT